MNKLVKRQKKMPENDRQYLLTRLYEGGVVWFNAHQIRAVEYFGDDLSCTACSMDCICDNDMNLLCAELDAKYDKKYILKLVGVRDRYE